MPPATPWPRPRPRHLPEGPRQRWPSRLTSHSPLRVKKRNTFLLSMRFMDPELETRYSVEKEKQSGAAFSCSCVVLLCTALVEIVIDPW